MDKRASFISGNIPERVQQIKAEGGQDIWLYGGAGLVTTFHNLNLIHIYRLSVHPMVLRSGKRLFNVVRERLGLKVVDDLPAPPKLTSHFLERRRLYQSAIVVWPNLRSRLQRHCAG